MAPFTSWGTKPRVKLKLSLKSGPARALPDILSTSLVALKESADAFPPLKSAVGGVLAVCEIAHRAKHSKAAARDIALRAKEILEVIADAVPDPSAIPPPMLHDIERFKFLLNDIRSQMEGMMLTSVLSRLVRLNRNEDALQSIKARLDDAYWDFLAASGLRVEVQQGTITALQTHIVDQQKHLAEQQVQLAEQQAQTTIAVRMVVDTLAPDLSRILYYSKHAFFLAHP
ncbi:hypothetical protein B0H16DRAFT_1738330 [Mycena metata]|uniref:Uncharacterized protein n=1 Tax=Mycena metata TaxID=1033252 RepID=A0AAD7ML59_9AGAR|nr:hypothetical protein B0H16DRAFT_1738330 [Mycena metata]